MKRARGGGGLPLAWIWHTFDGVGRAPVVDQRHVTLRQEHAQAE